MGVGELRKEEGKREAVEKERTERRFSDFIEERTIRKGAKRLRLTDKGARSWSRPKKRETGGRGVE